MPPKGLMAIMTRRRDTIPPYGMWYVADRRPAPWAGMEIEWLLELSPAQGAGLRDSQCHGTNSSRDEAQRNRGITGAAGPVIL